MFTRFNSRESYHNTGEGIVIRGNAANNLVGTLLYTFYSTRIFSNTMEIYYGKPFDHSPYAYKNTKKVLNIFTDKNTFKITKRVQNY